MAEAATTGDKKGILLETGTNEIEIVEFSIGDVNYGINVAKVREVITRAPVTEMPQAHPYVDGLFTLRGKAIPLVNLPRCLNVQTNEELKKYYFGAYSFKDTEDGWLQAFQYSEAQMDYFKGAFDFWYISCYE